ncbi:hypothetical protein QGM71_03495 [Virgibacillus sp. C22-A2]|uniref:Uncharacterized protein n=1 Tax=Virgibacillus tibetensis TaxID=3042313 RepID=A0ABU6KB36_9BACI|nr:hypothetical protein [Virgibacillus sp. C22-A2]
MIVIIVVIVVAVIAVVSIIVIVIDIAVVFHYLTLLLIFLNESRPIMAHLI